jgi:uroporphyrinogen-III synthase
MRVLVTRPEPDASDTAARIRARGHEAFVAPVLHTTFRADIALPPAPDLIALTSANAVKALALRPDLAAYLSIPVIAVGDTTARHAREAGFIDVASADGRAEDLVRTIAARDMAEGSLVLYPAGEDRAGDIEGALAKIRINTYVAALYATAMADALPDETLSALAEGRIDAIQILSRRTAQALVRLLTKYRLLETSRPISVHAMSHDALEPMVAAGFGAGRIAARPTLASLLDLIGEPGDPARSSNKR